MQNRIWGVSAAALALTCLTVTGCGTLNLQTSASTHSTLSHNRKNDKDPSSIGTRIHDTPVKIKKILFITPNRGYSIITMTKVYQNYIDVAKTTDGGHRWSVIPSLQIPNAGSIKPSETQIYHVNKNIWISIQASRGIYILHSSTKGTSWSKPLLSLQSSALIVKPNTGHVFLRFTSRSKGWLLLSTYPLTEQVLSSLYESSDGGATWRPVPLNHLPMSGPTTGLAISDKRLFITKCYPRTKSGNIPLYFTYKRNDIWKQQHLKLPQFTSRVLYSNAYNPVFFTKQDGLFLAAYKLKNGTNTVAVFRTYNSGISWSSSLSQPIHVPMNNLNISSYFLNMNYGWIMNNQLKLYRTKTSGQKWRYLANFPGSNTAISTPQITFINTHVGWILINTLHRSLLYQTSSPVIKQFEVC